LSRELSLVTLGSEFEFVGGQDGILDRRLR
jgi:hypothetical protein